MVPEAFSSLSNQVEQGLPRQVLLQIALAVFQDYYLYTTQIQADAAEHRPIHQVEAFRIRHNP
jgi:hypothetical protein